MQTFRSLPTFFFERLIALGEEGSQGGLRGKKTKNSRESWSGGKESKNYKSKIVKIKSKFPSLTELKKIFFGLFSIGYKKNLQKEDFFDFNLFSFLLSITELMLSYVHFYMQSLVDFCVSIKIFFQEVEVRFLFGAETGTAYGVSCRFFHFFFFVSLSL